MAGKTKLPVKQMLKLYEQGMHPDAIADAIGRHRSTVYMWLLRNGVHKPRTRPCRAIKHALEQDKIHPEIIAALRDVPAPVPSTRALAEIAGYGDSTIRMWLAGTRRPNDIARADFIQALRQYTAQQGEQS